MPDSASVEGNKFLLPAPTIGAFFFALWMASNSGETEGQGKNRTTDRTIDRQTGRNTERSDRKKRVKIGRAHV